ncbi:GntR family transcriptional regulator [Thaumasiovibrio sp. DFM-14]|uniref:GntR family transcriptional regulator n=1 Tax=Thaumasiovibrio sp. DFM-14 TaxID=3384792 RepID=UPI0039A149E4
MSVSLNFVDSTQGESEKRPATLAEQLTEAIVTGVYQPSEKLSEAEMAKRFGVSRGPLREAMMRLVSLGLVERAPNVGARVITLNMQTLAEVYSVREALEGMAARLAAIHISAAELDNLATLLQAHHAHIEQVDGASYFHQHGDFDFHYCIIKASRNHKLISLLCDELYHLLRMYRYQSPRSHSRPVSALNEHQQILEAMRERDGELAEMLMRRHIARSRQLIEQQLDKETV